MCGCCGKNSIYPIPESNKNRDGLQRKSATMRKKKEAGMGIETAYNKELKSIKL